MIPLSRTLAQSIRTQRTSLYRSCTYATLSPHTPPPITPYEIFDEPSKIAQRNRALKRLRSDPSPNNEGPAIVDYIREELAERLTERIEVHQIIQIHRIS
jgi:hypothetical protein